MELETSERVGVELALIGAVINEPKQLDVALARITKRDFLMEAHGNTFERLSLLRDAGKPVGDRKWVLSDLKQAGLIGETGASSIRPADMKEAIFDTVPANVPSYCEQIVRWSMAFEQRRIATEMLTALDGVSVDPIEIGGKASGKLDRLLSRQTLRVESVPNCASSFVDKLEAARLDGRDRGLTSGLAGIDAKIGGFVPGELTVVGARPSNGKTLFGMQVLRFNAEKLGRSCLFISLEMKGEDLAQRVLCGMTKIPSQRVRSGELTEDECRMFREAADAIKGLSVDVYDDGNTSIRKIRALAKLQQMSGRLDMMVVDYISLIKPTDASKPRHEQVAEIAQGLKDIALELRIPVIALAQLNRKSGDAEKDMPKMSQLRESGHIEQCADVVILIHNPPGVDDFRPMLFVEKARQATTGSIEVRWNKEELRFEDYDGSTVEY